MKITAVDVPAFTFGGSVAISTRKPLSGVFIGKTQTPTIRPPVPEKVHRQRQADRGAVELGIEIDAPAGYCAQCDILEQ